MRQRLPAIDATTATGEVRSVLDEAQLRFGTSSNVMRIMANSPAALIGYLALDTALTDATLDVSLRYLIALAVAEANACEGCAAVHAAAGLTHGLDEAAIEAARHAASPDPKVEAALRFARTVAEYRGDVTDEEFDRIRRAGYSNQEIAEIIANVALSVYANYFNTIAQPESRLND